jgi:Fe-S cluster biogenesis protein NfuA
MADANRLDDPAVEHRLGRLDALLDQLQHTPGRTAEVGLEAVETVLEVYGEALSRVTERLGAGPELTGDELLRHLLLLHHIHPDGTQERIGRAVRDAGDQLRRRGARVELVAVEEDTAVVRVASGSCGACGDTTALHDVVRDEVLAAAPELAGVRFVDAEPAATLIPLAAVRHR